MDVPQITYSVKKKKWILTKDFYYADNLTLIKIPHGFEFDLASIPRFLWVIIPPFSLSITAPLIHDYLYNKRGIVENNTYTLSQTDKLFEKLMESEEVPRWKRKSAYIAVRLFGWLYWYDIIK